MDVLRHCNIFCSHEHGIQLALGIRKTTVQWTASFLRLISTGSAAQTVLRAARTKQNVRVSLQGCAVPRACRSGHGVQPSVDRKQARGLLTCSLTSGVRKFAFTRPGWDGNCRRLGVCVSFPSFGHLVHWIHGQSMPALRFNIFFPFQFPALGSTVGDSGI